MKKGKNYALLITDTKLNKITFAIENNGTAWLTKNGKLTKITGIEGLAIAFAESLEAMTKKGKLLK